MILRSVDYEKSNRFGVPCPWGRSAWRVHHWGNQGSSHLWAFLLESPCPARLLLLGRFLQTSREVQERVASLPFSVNCQNITTLIKLLFLYILYAIMNYKLRKVDDDYAIWINRYCCFCPWPCCLCYWSRQVCRLVQKVSYLLIGFFRRWIVRIFHLFTVSSSVNFENCLIIHRRFSLNVKFLWTSCFLLWGMVQ